jgi:hypothetical protein
MGWVRIHPFVQNWPGGGSPPIFDISADENGSVTVELAWDPQALAAPSAGYAPLRYYTSGSVANIIYTDDGGSSRSISIPAQTIQLASNRASWSIPADLWDAYVQESLKTLRTPPSTTFARNLYYRVRATPPGAAQARIWPGDSVLTSKDSNAAPHIGVLPISASPSSQVIPDQDAVAAMGGILLFPNLWGDSLMWLWRHLPETDLNRQALARIFAHQDFQGADLSTRVAMLKLWLFAGPTARPRLSELLDRRAVLGSNTTRPIISKVDLRDGHTLAQNLVELLNVAPHPDLVNITSKEQLLDDVITEILDPNGQVNQGAAGTCAPTSIQTQMLSVNPSEYARLQTGWLSAAGQATLADGSVADVPAGVLRISAYATAGVATSGFVMRSYSELAFQSAILKFGQGARFPALTGTPQNVNAIFQATIKGGMLYDEIKRALDALFIRSFTTHLIPLPPDASNASWAAAQRAVRDSLIQDLPAHDQGLIVAVFWNPLYSGAHAIVGVRRDGGRIFFKNPQYAGSNPLPGITQGGLNSNPPRRYEDPTQSLESITDTELASWIIAYWVPNAVIG